MTEADQGSQPSSSKLDDIIELVKRLCLALTNAEMFTVDHPLAVKGIDSAYEWLASMFERRNEPVVISSSGKTLLLEGLPLEEKNPLVGKLVKRLDDIHVHNLFFDPGVTKEEFEELFRILGKGPRVIGESGGFPKLLEEAKLEHIRIREISYVMVTEDQKVVDRDAQVVDGAIAGLSSDAEIVKYMVWKVMQKADEQKWLIDEMKNNPQKMADLITQGIDLASSRAEMGIKDDDGAINTLLSNIRLVGQNLIDEKTGEVKEGEEDMEKALLTLENEMRLRSSKLMSSKVATGFINEILSVVTAYSDQVRAKKLSDEFVKGETGMRRTEQMLRSMLPKDEPMEGHLTRMRGLLEKKGISKAEIENLIRSVRDGDGKKPAKPRKPRKAYSQAVYDGIVKRMKDLKLEGPKLQETTESLSSFVEDRAREKAGEIREEAEKLRGVVEKQARALATLPVGLVLWDQQGKIDFINPAAQEVAGLTVDTVLSETLRAALKKYSFPLDDVPDFTQETGLAESDRQLILSVMRTIADDVGNIYGLILMPTKK